MTYGIGDTCYILEDGQVKRGRISSKKDEKYFVQFVGQCGAIAVDRRELFKSPEEAEENRKKDDAYSEVKYL